MFIKIEPAGFFMHTVKLIFDLDNPDSEDVEVRDYLAKHELEPRYRWDDKLDDDKAEVIQLVAVTLVIICKALDRYKGKQ